MDKLIDVGQIVNTHGLRGEVKINPWTDAPEVFEAFDTLYLKDGSAYKVQGVRYQKSCVLAKLEGISDVDEAEKLRGSIVYTDRDVFLNLPEDTYLVADIIGLTVMEGTRTLGIVQDVINTGSNDVYSIRTSEGKMMYLPAIKDVIKDICLEDGHMEVVVPKGLEE